MAAGAKNKKSSTRNREPNQGLMIHRHFTKNINDPRNFFDLKPRRVEIKDSSGDIIYQNNKSFFPDEWSKLSSRVVASKYFYKGDEKEHVENRLDNLVGRVVDTIAKKAVKQNIMSKERGKIFADELFLNIMNKGSSFNSPVWFNVGLYDAYGITDKKENESHFAIKDRRFTNKIDVYKRPQASACFIQSIEDCMEDIMDHAKREAMLFKFGSGTGTNFSSLRGIGEPLSGGGLASGQISFFKIYDIIAGSIMSGGKTRRAAKMVIQDCDHPDLLRFAQWKAREEQKALWLCAQPRWGPRNSLDLESEAYKSITGQNGNNTVRVTDKFMGAALAGSDWSLWFRTADRVKAEIDIPLEEYKDDRYLPDKKFVKRLTNKRKIINAGEALEQICRAAAVSGDPAVQYDDNINKWNTVPNFARINASNPCSEFMAPDDTACNLASLNLTRYSKKNPDSFYHKRVLDTKQSGRTAASKGLLDLVSFKQSVRNTIIAQETLVDYSSYPSKKIAENSHKLRPLGLGYTNLGALLMENGLDYDSDGGRALASAITSLMTAYAYQTSAELAEKLGTFEEFNDNKKEMLDVLKMHYDETKKIKRISEVDGLEEVLDEADKVWRNVLRKGAKTGFRNSQVTLIAPTGTIGFMMDVDCTGVEAMPALAYKKALAGGGELEIELKPCVRKGLETLGYKGEKLERILDYIKKGETIIDAPGLAKEHYNVFATAISPDNAISVDGHLNMMAAVQPFVSGAISKTVNLPKGSTIQDVRDTYIKGWKLGLKSISLYVDGSKGVQPINVKSKAEKEEMMWGERDKPINSMSPNGFIHRAGWNVDIGKTGVQITIGEYDNRTPRESPAEIFVSFGKSGSSYSAIYELWSREASRGIQKGPKGVSIDELIKHNLGATGPINGLTNHPYIKQCSSIPDFIAKLIRLEYYGDTSVCKVEDGKEISENVIRELRCNVLANQRRTRHYQSKIDFIDTALRDGKLEPVFPLLLDKLEAGKLDVSQIYCKVCGWETELSGANCRKCYNCGDSEGCG